MGKNTLGRAVTLSFVIMGVIIATGLWGCAASTGQSDSLQGDGAGQAETQGNMMEYRVLVKEEDGTPVEGALVQFCTDNQCMSADTDGSGLTAFSAEPGVYEIHLLKVPELFSLDETVYKTDEEGTMVEIVVERSGG